MTCEIGPLSPLVVTLEVNPEAGLRAVLCLQVHDLDHGTTTITDPLFLTTVQDRIITSDLLADLLSDDALDIFRELESAHGDQDELARCLRIPLVDLTSRLDAAVAELGTPDLVDAMELLSTITV